MFLNRGSKPIHVCDGVFGKLFDDGQEKGWIFLSGSPVQ